MGEPGPLRRALTPPGARAAALALALLTACALGADLLASDQPLWVTLDGRSYLLPALTRPPALRPYDNASLARLGARVSGLQPPPVPFGPLQTDLSQPVLRPPSARHPLGTDGVGRDVAARLLHGARTSLAVGLSASVVAGLLGLLLGALAGFAGGRADALLSRSLEVVQAFPALFLLLTIVAALPRAGLAALALVLGLTRSAEVARLARAEAARVRTLPFVEAARALGSPAWRTLRVHVLPHAAGPALVAAGLAVGSAILAESALAFLGLGAPAPTPSWGELLAQAREHPRCWWLAAAPGAALFLTVAACQRLAEGFRDALAVRSADGTAAKLQGPRS